MKKFTNLLFKEIRELINKQLIFSLLFTMIIFYFIGQVTRTEAKRAETARRIGVLDLDKSAISRGLLDNLRLVRFQIEEFETIDKEEALRQAREKNLTFLLVIPSGLNEGVEKLETKEIETYSFLRSFSIGQARYSDIFKIILETANNYLSNEMLKKKLPEISPENLKKPLKSRDFVIVRDKKAEASASAIVGFMYAQSIFVPIVLFMILIYSSQMVISAIALEKQNKTLETLLTVPISRSAIVAAKMLAAGLVGLLSAFIYMAGFSWYMKGFTGDLAETAGGITKIIKELGLTMTTSGNLILLISLFLAIMCALAMATILGVLAEDYRSAQSLLLPLMLLVMIPYFLSIFTDFKSLSLPVRILIYAIPFSHPFMTTQNILFHNYRAIVFGILYMLIVFIILVILAARIFSTDRVLTMKLRWRRREVVL
ncbi:MAG: ABC transporter permease [Candidatus Aminicenantes bacterium]|nr:ABC transporter permease [Candidatus Aminicenantes bacterium]